jgi:N-acyl-D-amino-acid deacylase
MSERYDILIKNTTIVDGSGQPAFLGSVGVRGEKIAAVGDIAGEAARVIDGAGLITSPGFVDPHSHTDMSILRYPLAENLVMQGVTTSVGGNCGISQAPFRTVDDARRVVHRRAKGLDVDWQTFGEWLSRVDAAQPSFNYVPLVGHNTIREAVMGPDFRRQASPAEIEEMKQLVDEAMQSGAFGFSTGLDPRATGHFSSTDEIVELTKVSQRHGGLLAQHTRHQEPQWPAARPEDVRYSLYWGSPGEMAVGRWHGIKEALQIGKEANIRLHIAHLMPGFLVPQPHPYYLDEAVARATLDLIDEVRAEGIEVTFDIISWIQAIGKEMPVLLQSFFSPELLLPDWLRELSPEEFGEKLKTRAFREKVKGVVNSGVLKFGMVHPLTDPYWIDCYKILRCKIAEYEGQILGNIVRRRCPNRFAEAVYDETYEILFDMLAEDPHTTWALIIDKRETVHPVFLKHPGAMPSADIATYPAKLEQMHDPSPAAAPPPIAFGLFPHYIRFFVKEQGVLGLEEAIRKATFAPAQEYLGLKDRGILREGAYADILVFDFDKIEEGGDFFEPTKPPEGIEHVLVNGTVVYENKAHTGARPGKVLRRP